MGFAFTQAAFNTDKAGGLNKLVLWVICEHANEKNKDEAWPSIPTIAMEAGVCVNTVMKATRCLESAGLIQVVRTKVTTKDGKPQNLVNRYRPIISAMTDEGGSAPDAVPPTPCDAVPYSTTCTTPTPPHALPPSAPDAPPYCTTCTVTSNEPVMVEPVTVNQVSQNKGQERKEESKQVAEASPPFSGQSESEELKEWSEKALRLVRKLNPVQDDSTVSCEGAFAQMSVDYLEGASVDPCDLVDYNWTHKAPKFPKLRISSCQWLWERVLRQGTNLRLVNEYVGHESDGCKECGAGRLVSWAKKHEETRKAAQVAAWQELENQRLEKLAQYEFRPPTTDEIKVFKSLREEGWPEGAINKMLTAETYPVARPAAWNTRHVDAAILTCLQKNEPQTFESFAALVGGIMELDKETPWEMATTA